MFRTALSCAKVSALIVFGFPQASAAETCPVLEGFAPLEALPVYEGACLYGAEDAGFSRFELPTGPMKGQTPLEVKPVEGQLQRRLYVAPEGVSALDLFRNYQTGLLAAGFVPLFECSGRACGSNNALLGKTVIYGSERQLRNLGQLSQHALYIQGDEYYLAAVSADGTRHVALYVAQNRKAQISGAASERAAVHLDFVTSAALDARMIDAAAMAKGLADDGRIALDNVYFDFGTANLSPESAPAIAEMAKLLSNNPALKVQVVGHTDWVGQADANLTLSRQRADAVAAALVGAGIATNRISAAGVGMLSPRATNTTDAGRALNRRVELVELPPQN